MAKRLSEKEKKEIVKIFYEGKTIPEIAYDFGCTNLTITRNLKKLIGEEEYNQFINKNKVSIQESTRDGTRISNENEYINYENFEEDNPITPFMEITPLDLEIENAQQKDFSSVPINDVKFPKIVFMVVDKKIELEIKYLKDYPNWHFLSQDDLSRKTIEIYEDLKLAKRSCNKEQKVIKVPNTEVFKIAAPILLSKGISRIINDDKLIAL